MTIKGIQLSFTADELVEHLAKRVEYHREKAGAYERQAADVAALQPESGQSNDPVAALRMSQRQHASKAELFQLMLDHLNRDEDYLLSDVDLTRLEIISSFF